MGTRYQIDGEDLTVDEMGAEFSLNWDYPGSEGDLEGPWLSPGKLARMGLQMVIVASYQMGDAAVNVAIARLAEALNDYDREGDGHEESD